MGFRAPAVAPLLFGAAAAVTAWALLAAGALGVYGPVGLTVHRRGLLVLAGALVVLPLASGKLTHAELDVPCVLAAGVLCRVGLVRWVGLGAPPPRTRPADWPLIDVGTPGNSDSNVDTAPVGPVAVEARPAPGAARVAGRWTGRAGTVFGREAASALPRAARAAGRAIGRARHEPPQR